MGVNFKIPTVRGKEFKGGDKRANRNFILLQLKDSVAAIESLKEVS